MAMPNQSMNPRKHSKRAKNKTNGKERFMRKGRFKTEGEKYSSNLYEKLIGSINLRHPDKMKRNPTMVRENMVKSFMSRGGGGMIGGLLYLS